MTLAAEEFIRRFLLHVLPDGFQRIRYYGFLANRYRAEKLALCRQLLQTPLPAPNVEVKKDYRDRYEEITGVSLKTCPLCRHGTMIVIETFECAASRAPRMDTSSPSLRSRQHISTVLARSRERDCIAACSLISTSECNLGVVSYF